MSTSQRVLWMDFVRGMFIFLVIVTHASYAIENYGVDIPRTVVVFNEAFAPFRMPVLMFLSGMLLDKSLRKPVSVYLPGKFKSIFWPYLLWSVIALVATERVTMRNVLVIPIISPTFLWYLWFLLAYYIGALIMHRLRIPFLPVMMLSLMAAEFLPEAFRMSRFAFLFSFFLFGYVVSSNGGRILDYLQQRTGWAMLGALLSSVGAVVSVSGVDVRYSPLFFWAPAGMILLLLWVTAYYKPTAATRLIEMIGQGSIVFYVTHLSLQWIMARYLIALGIEDFWVLMGTISASCIVVGWGLLILRRRYATVSMLFDLQAAESGSGSRLASR